ncbi:MAG: diguanylate cyclase [Deltaproteobacteria bacterium]|nr:diguanylate cyclase [Deltaproteobacteria bacterium]
MSNDRLPRRSRRLGTRLAAVVALTLVVVGGGVAMVAVSQTARAYRDESLQRAAAMLAMLAGPAALAVAESTFDKLDGYLAEAVRPGDQDVQLVAVVTFDSAGRAVAASTDALVPPVVPGHDAATSQDFVDYAVRSRHPMWRRLVAGKTAHLLVSVPAVSGLRWGTLVGVFDTAMVEQRVERTLRSVLAVVCAAAGLLAAVTYAAFARMAVRPMQELARAAEAIRHGARGQRLHWQRGDELGLMAASFDHMAAEVERFTTNLEQQVAERSAEVEARNHDLRVVNAQLRMANAELDRLAHVDPLTAVGNRRSFDQLIAQVAGAGDGRTWALLMCDIDHFKRVNDTYGHQMGDLVLREVARVLHGELRGNDHVARFGGEEFVVLLDGAGPDTALDVARRLVQVVAHHDFEALAGVPLGRITVSIGVAVHPLDGLGADQLLEHTDMALYAAKSGGRNRVERWRPELRCRGAEG